MTPREQALYDCLAANLSAWEDEEDSVQTEHRVLIKRTQRVLNESAQGADIWKRTQD